MIHAIARTLQILVVKIWKPLHEYAQRLNGQGPWTAKLAYQGQFAGNTHYSTFDLIANYRW